MSFTKKLLMACCILAIIGIATAGGIVLYFAQQLPTLNAVEEYKPALGMRIYDRKGRLIHQYYRGDERRELIDYEQVPLHVKQAFIAAEDGDFYSHFGFDPVAIARAAIRGLMAGRIRGGGSTITQQLVKNLYLTPEKTITRKLKELILAWRIEQQLTKDEILFLYLNEIYLGPRSYGIEMASRNYFGKSATEITVAEAAILAGLPQRPGDYRPDRNPKSARARQTYALGQMKSRGMIDDQTYQQAMTEVVHILPQVPEESPAPYLTVMVRNWAIDTYGENEALTSGLQVWTTIDLDAQLAAQRAIQFGTSEIERSNGYDGPITTMTADESAAMLTRQWNGLKAQWYAAHNSYITTVPPEAYQPVTMPETADIYELAGTQSIRAVVTKVLGRYRSIEVSTGTHKGLIPEAEMYIAKDPNFDTEDRYPPYSVVEDAHRVFNVGDVVWMRLTKAPEEPEKERYLRGDWPTILDYIQRNKKEYDFFATLDEPVKVQSALVSVEPSSGDLLAVVGGRDFASSQYNRAIQAHRQVGSSFKPFVYATAIEQGLTVTHTIVDDRLRYEDWESISIWRPQNYEREVAGEPVTLLNALTKSKNTITIQLANEIGLNKIISTAKQFGFTSDLPKDLTVALGSASMTPLEVARGYAALAAGGLVPATKFIHEVRTSDGQVIYAAPREGANAGTWQFEDQLPVPTPNDIRFAARPQLPRMLVHPATEPVQAVSDTTAYIVTNMLKSVVQRGTGFRARALGRISAGKTGTTNDNVDSWYCGYVPQLATAVWVGYDDIRPLGPIMTGSRAAAPIWLEYMQQALENVENEDFFIPPNIVLREIDPETGYLADLATARPWTAAFVAGSEPTLQQQIEIEKIEEDSNLEQQILEQFQ